MKVNIYRSIEPQLELPKKGVFFYFGGPLLSNRSFLILVNYIFFLSSPRQIEWCIKNFESFYTVPLKRQSQNRLSRTRLKK